MAVAETSPWSNQQLIPRTSQVTDNVDVAAFIVTRIPPGVPFIEQGKPDKSRMIISYVPGHNPVKVYELELDVSVNEFNGFEISVTL